jgi:hypothetical protein
MTAVLRLKVQDYVDTAHGNKALAFRAYRSDQNVSTAFVALGALVLGWAFVGAHAAGGLIALAMWCGLMASYQAATEREETEVAELLSQ